MNGIKTISSDRSNLHEIASKQFLKNFRWLFFTINLYILSKVLSCMFPLFNLQGTRPKVWGSFVHLSHRKIIPMFPANFYIVAHLKALVKNFFKFF